MIIRMRTIFLFFLVVQCFLTVSGQVTFDKGYIIDNSGIKTECLIKNHDWRSNPKTIQYKLSEESPAVPASIDSIQAFGVDNYSKFVRATVKIDRSPIDIGSLSDKRGPLWSQETLFLRELTCGKASLWVYTEDRSWFFYSLDGSQPELLVYKQYYSQEKHAYRQNHFQEKIVIRENLEFKQQLYNYLRNENTKNVNLGKLRYDEKSLVKYFKLYNSYYGNNEPAEGKKPEREVLNVKITGSLNYSWLKITDLMKKYKKPDKFDFGGKANWMGGLELEYFLPFNRNTWSLLFAPTFEHYRNSKTVGNFPVNIDMASVRFPVGARYSLYLNNDMKFFFDGYYNPTIYINKNDGFAPMSYIMLDIEEADNFIVGGGFAYKKWQVELQYHTDRDLFREHIFWETDYTKIVMSVSYKLFSIRK